MRSIAARGIVPGTATGPALVSTTSVSFLGDIDIRTGEIVNAESAIRGRSVAGTVLVVPGTSGSAGAWRFLYQLHVHGTSPAALVSTRLPDSSLVQGAILAGVPIVCEPDEDVVASLTAGQTVHVDADAGLLTVTSSPA